MLEAHAAYTRLGNGRWTGCDGCAWSGLLPLFADGTSEMPKAYSAGRISLPESGRIKEIGDYNHEFKTACSDVGHVAVATRVYFFTATYQYAV